MSTPDPPPVRTDRLGGEGPVRVTARAPRAAGGDGGPPSFLRAGEFLVLLATVLAVLIAAAVADDLDAGRAWTLVTVLAAAYIVSRGLAKLGRQQDDRDV
jgi:hypothetical protein